MVEWPDSDVPEPMRYIPVIFGAGIGLLLFESPWGFVGGMAIGAAIPILIDTRSKPPEGQ